MNAEIEAAFQCACSAREEAYAPYSNFQVGAAVHPVAGARWFTGHNIENASYGATVCAERVAIWSAMMEGHRQFDALVLVTDTEPVAPPCGQCLQVMAEFMKPDVRIYLANLQGIQKELAFRDLLPATFAFPND